MGEPTSEQDMGTAAKEPAEKITSTPLLEAAGTILKSQTPLITDKAVFPPKACKNDFVSLSPYFYQTEGGGEDLTVRDGEINPMTKKYPDSENLGKAAGDIFITSLAAKLTENQGEKEAFAGRAISVINAWFIDEETRMTPSFEFAHMKPGEETGNFWGIICGNQLIRAIDGVNLLKDNGLIDEKTLKGVEGWFGQYLKWLLESKKAIGDPTAGNEKERGGEKGMANNHGTFYDVQVAYIADFLGNSELAKATIEGAKERIKSQLNPDGEMPLETARATPYDYQLFNLYGFCELALLGQKYDIDLWNYQTDDGRGLKNAFNYFANKLENAGDTPFKENKSGELYFAFRAASRAYDNPAYWELPKTYYPDPLVDEVTQEMFQ